MLGTVKASNYNPEPIVKKRRGRLPQSEKANGKATKASKPAKRKNNLPAEEYLSVEDEEVYEVESIKAMRMTPVAKGLAEYFIKWVGFTDAFNTWEHVDNLNCPELLEAFKKALAANPELDITESDVTFPPPATKDSWEPLVDAVDGLREIEDEDGSKQIVARIFWKCGFETEEELESCIKAVPRQLLRFLLSKLKFKTN